MKFETFVFAASIMLGVVVTCLVWLVALTVWDYLSRRRR